MATIELYGWGTVFRIVTLPQKLVNELTKKQVDDDRLDEIFVERWKREIGRAGFGLEFDVLLDGKVIPRSILNGVHVHDEEPTMLKKGKAYLVRQELQKGCWSHIETEGDFDIKKMMFVTDPLVMVDGTRYELMDLQYDGETQFGDTVGKNLEEYVILKDGTRVDVKKLENC